MRRVVARQISDRCRYAACRDGASHGGTPPGELWMGAVVLRAESRRSGGGPAKRVREDPGRKGAVQRPLIAEDLAVRRHSSHSDLAVAQARAARTADRE